MSYRSPHSSTAVQLFCSNSMRLAHKKGFVFPSSFDVRAEVVWVLPRSGLLLGVGGPPADP